MSVVNAVQPSGVPILSVDEQIFFLPPGGHRVHNRARKLLFFFEADCRHRIAELGDASTLALETGDVLILPQACRQDYLAKSRHTTRIHALRIVIDPEIVPPLLLGQATPKVVPTPFGDEPIETFIAATFSRTMHLKGGMTGEVRETLARLRRESEETAGARGYGYRYRAAAICLELMVLVARQMERAALPSTPRSTPNAMRVEEVREYIIRHLDTPLRLETIAAHLNITPEHLARVWKKATGTTIFDYIRRARVERAKSLLTSTDVNISQVAAACGFSSLALFSRTFKQETGFSPNRYRERLAQPSLD